MIKYFEYGVHRNSDDTLEVEAYLIDDIINHMDRFSQEDSRKGVGEWY